MIDSLLVVYSAGKATSSRKGPRGMDVAGSIARGPIRSGREFVGTSRGLGKHSRGDNSVEKSDDTPVPKRPKTRYF